MGAAAAPLLAESLMAESFVMAAPEMFAASSTFVPAAGEFATLGAMEGFGGLSALGSEFGTEALFSGLGAEGFGGLSAIGSEFGTEALFGGLGETIAPTLGEGVVQGVSRGLGGAGQAGINEAMVGAQQAQATNTIEQQIMNQFQNADKLAGGIREAYPAVEQVAGEGLRGSMYDLASKGAPDLIPEVSNAFNPSYNLAPDSASGALRMGTGENIKTAMTELPKAAPSSLQSGFETALKYVKENPFSSASMAMNAKTLLGNKKEEEEAPAGYNGILTKYKMSPNFQGRQANPEDFQYTPKVYAEGGVASFKSGGRSDNLDPTGGGKIASDYYESMLRQQAQNMPSTKGDVGVYYDLDPETRYLDPVSAAQIRMAKINKRSNVQAQNMKRPRGLGQINLSPPGAKAQEADTTDAARGGIMQSSLGGYAAGGNPRLLKGPGDGMSDNIPATIAGKQPARLADGEFVIPADVVSHLGNGSTEAGAKVLHAMMTKVRKERTGNPKQGKQINPRKFVPT